MEIIKLYARSFYDFQEVKNEFANRLRASEMDIPTRPYSEAVLGKIHGEYPKGFKKEVVK